MRTRAAAEAGRPRRNANAEGPRGCSPPFGLYGSFVVEPRQPTRTYDRDYTYLLAEWDLELTPAVASGRAPRGPGDRLLRGGEIGTDLFLMNGRAHGAIPPIRVAEGAGVRAACP